MGAVHFLIFLATFMNFSNVVIKASPTAAVQLSAMPYASATFALVCGTVARLLSTSRGDQKVLRPPVAARSDRHLRLPHRRNRDGELLELRHPLARGVRRLLEGRDGLQGQEAASNGVIVAMEPSGRSDRPR